jgi:hypothetical protein
MFCGLCVLYGCTVFSDSRADAKNRECLAEKSKGCRNTVNEKLPLGSILPGPDAFLKSSIKIFYGIIRPYYGDSSDALYGGNSRGVSSAQNSRRV